MTAISNLIRKTSRNWLHQYFQLNPHPIAEAVNWNDNDSDHVKPLLKAVDKMSDQELGMLKVNLERIHEMTDEIGQRALLSRVQEADLETYLSLQSEYDRAHFIFLRDPKAFQYAEDIRYADEYRKSRMWDGFVGPADLSVSRNPEHIEDLKQKIAGYFRTGGRLKVEILALDHHL